MTHRTFARRRPAPDGLRASPVATACALLGLATAAQAQQTQAATPETQTIVVTGIRRSIENSIATKRNSDSIVEAISAEDIGKLPDASIAESLARLPGLTGQRGADGRVNVISIRGLSPAFSGVLLNGREIVSSNDGRAVEYDQFPSELIGAATVYKTPSATLIGQGLSGTVDLMARRPLDTRGREMAINVRGETNSLKTQVPGVASPTGNRVSLSYVNQFADNTIGVALGFAHLESTTQARVLELDQYGDYTPYGVPIVGTVPSLFQAPSVTWGPVSQAMLPMFWTGSQFTKKNTRDGLMAVLEYKPNKDLRSQLDLYYSKFDTHEVGGKLTSNMFASWGERFGYGASCDPSAGFTSPCWNGPLNTLTNVGTTQVGQNTYATSATASALPTTTTNWDTKRSDKISAIGWNTSLKVGGQWTLTSDLAYSKDVRDEVYQEVYAGPWDNANNRWAYGPFQWNVPVTGGAQTFTPLQPGFLSNPANIRFGDVVGFDYVPGESQWTGVVRDPHSVDVIKSLKLQAKRPIELLGVFSQVTGGVNYTQRDKSIEKNETRLLMPLDPNSTTICQAPQDFAGPCNRTIPAGAVGAPLNMSWMGVPQFIRLDVPYLVSSGALQRKAAEFQLKGNDAFVNEKITTAFVQLDIDAQLGNIPLRGNFGVQAVYSDQRSEGYEYLGLDNNNPDLSKLFRRSGGAKYDDILPSLNLVAELRPDLITRFGLGMQTARPEINAMRAGGSTPRLNTDPGPNEGTWQITYAGNPELKPWKASAIDLSIEKYFGKRSYVSFAAFRKNLLSYVIASEQPVDRSGTPLPPGYTPSPGVVVQQFGGEIKPRNGSGGRVEGFEVAAALEGALLSPMLDGFGIVLSASKLNSSIRDQRVDQNSNLVVVGSSTPINGLSGRSNSMTVYYEKHGFSARVSQRYRSPFTATTRDIFFRPTTRSQGADKVVDMQLGYAFDDAGMYRGLSLLLQVNNLTDTGTTNYKTPGNADVPDPTQLVPNYNYKFGRQILAGLNYKF
ncbi:MAG TPA: TonB-dependent receptor [Burkholderiaceae bacterium]|nr:TonB-dependent receptor [Burkholderiaceae bacterium]